MDELSALRERLATQRPVAYEQMPDFPLYMDQMLSYMERQVLRFDDGDALTAAMVNNYTKSGLVPRAAGKRYGREHLAYLTAICVLKHVMSTRDIDLLLNEELQGGRTIAQGYGDFCASLDSALTLTAREMEQYTDEEALAGAAIHFALISYAAGAASSRYVALLRQRKEQPEKSSKPPKKGRKDKEGELSNA